MAEELTKAERKLVEGILDGGFAATLVKLAGGIVGNIRTDKKLEQRIALLEGRISALEEGATKPLKDSR